MRILLHVAYGIGVVSVILNISTLVLIRLKLGCFQNFALPSLTESLEVSELPAAKFNAYLKNFGKRYEGGELRRRFGIFQNSLKDISRMNRESGARFGLTKFSDMLREEVMAPGFERKLENFGESTTAFNCGNGPHNPSKLDYHRDKIIPDRFDWRDKKYVGPVLNQKQCQGCWAFGIAGAMETQAAIINGIYGPRLSIQELIDCSEDTKGCEKGNVVLALSWFCAKNWGVVTETEYPLKLVTQHCKYPPHYSPVGLRLRQFWKLTKMREEDIPRLVYYYGPVIVVVNADPWLGYIDGIIQDACVRREDNSTTDHVVQIVGYDKTPGVIAHYIVRNSWGDDFGMDGYVNLAMGKNICGVADEGVILQVHPY